MKHLRIGYIASKAEAFMNKFCINGQHSKETADNSNSGVVMIKPVIVQDFS